MLVLTRKRSEEIIIAGKIRVVVVDVKGDKVRIGIEAPPSVRVMRKEIVNDDEGPNPKDS